MTMATWGSWEPGLVDGLEGHHPQSHLGSTASSPFPTAAWSMVPTLHTQGWVAWSPRRWSPRVRRWWRWGGMGVEAHVSLRGGASVRHTGSTCSSWPGAKTSLRPPESWTACEEDVLGRVFSSGCVLSLGGTWKCRHRDDLFSSPTPAPARRQSRLLLQHLSSSPRSPTQRQTRRLLQT